MKHDKSCTYIVQPSDLVGFRGRGQSFSNRRTRQSTDQYYGGFRAVRGSWHRRKAIRAAGAVRAGRAVESGRAVGDGDGDRAANRSRARAFYRRGPSGH